MAERSTAAIRFAEAIFQVARDNQSYDLWLRELSDVQHLLADPQAARVLTSPAIPQDRKSRILAEALPGQSEQVKRLLDLLGRRGRLELVPGILESLRQLINRERGVDTARVTTAVPLDAAERELIATRLSGRTGKKIQIEASVDPSIIGGVVAQIGDEIIDGSVRGRLDRLRRAVVGS